MTHPRSVVQVAVCGSCAQRAVLVQDELPDDFPERLVSDVKSVLEARDSSREWVVERGGCFRFCPKGRVTLSVTCEEIPAGRLSLSKTTTAEAVADEVQRTLKPAT